MIGCFYAMKTEYPIIKTTIRGHSNFALINAYWKAKEDTNDRAFHRLCSLMRKMNAKSVIVEKLGAKEFVIAEERKALKKYFNKAIDTDVYRFTFISKYISKFEELKDLPNDKYYATAIIFNLKNPTNNKWHSYLHSAIVTIPKKQNKFLLNNYIHVKKEFTCTIKDKDNKKLSFKITGTYFCQQNNITSVCAHAALCMTINNNSPSTSRLISTEWINKTLNIDHNSRRVGSGQGLITEEVIAVLQKAKLKITWLNFKSNPDSDYADYIYRYMEGGAPSLLIFTTKNEHNLHVVPVIGHTLNSDIWHAEAELAYKKRNDLNYRPASEWVDHFIISDDNFGMYLCLPVNSLKKTTDFVGDPEFRAYTAIIVVPIDLKTPAIEAELTSVTLIRTLLASMKNTNTKLDNWLERLTDPSVPIVARTLLITKDNYEQHLRIEKDFSRKSFSEDEIKGILDGLPNNFFLTEITLPDLYTANKSKILDVLYICDKPPTVDQRELYKRWLLVRIPGACVKNRKDNKLVELTVNNHYPLFRKEKNLSIPEW